MTSPSAIVVGGGIMGCSAARALHNRGWSVTLLEQASYPHVEASSGGVHRLIRSTYGTEAGWTSMIPLAYAAWDRLWHDLGPDASRGLMTHTGMLAVDTPATTFGADSAATLAALDLPFTLHDADELRRRWPQLRIPADAAGMYTEDGHFLRAGRIVTALAAWLRLVGVDVREQALVHAVELEVGRVTLADGTVLAADRVVVAAGPWTGRLLDDVGGGLTPSRQVVLDVEPPAHLRAAWADGPAFLLPPLYGIPPRDGLPLKVSDHAFTLTGDPDDDRDPSPDEIAAVREVAAEALTDFAQYRLLEARACYYTFHAEERFVVEPLGARGAVMAGFSGHGFKFGALLGDAVGAALDEAAAWPDVSAWAAGHSTTSPLPA